MRKKVLLATLLCVGLFSAMASASMNHEVWNQTITNSRPGIINFLVDLVNPVPTPSSVDVIPDSTFRGSTDNYVAKFYGWVTVPANGDYRFHYSCDDYGMLYVSQDEEMKNAVEVAYVDGWCSPAQWDKYPATQHSAVMTLKKGQVMAIMAFYDEQSGGDQMDIGWTGPGLSQSVTAPDLLGDNCTHLPPTPTAAKAVEPTNQATDVARDSVLSWTGGKFAATHNLYFGTDLDAVTNATKDNPMGVLVSTGQSATTFDPAGFLTYGQTYYWRVDEVNAPPTDSTVFKGSVWSFTAETYGYKITSIKATASSSLTAAMGPGKTIDGSGIDPVTDGHGVFAGDMWLSKKGLSPVWIQYEFDKAYKLFEMWVWNSNQAVESAVGFGAQDVTVEYSIDGTTWTKLEGVEPFAQALGEDGYQHSTTVSFGGASAKFVKLTVNTNWADGTKQGGLSEVRFFYVPMQAFNPSPADGKAEVPVGATLNWRPGREAAKHELLISADANAVANGTVAAKTVTEHKYDVTSLNLDYGRTYYWKVNEVNDAAAAPKWDGNVWSFTTIAYAAVDDFEAYDDACKRIFFSWVDGFGHNGSVDCGVPASSGNATGSTVGNDGAPFAERTIVHLGGKSMPVRFDNSKSPFYSEAQREWTGGTSWTGGGVNALALYVRGDAPAFVETTPGTIIMNGMGTDIWANADQFRFVYKQLKGNGSMVAKVESIGNTNEWAKAGVMIRESLAAGSAHAFTAATPTATHGVSFQRRLVTDDVSTNTDSTGIVPLVPLPVWVKITRTGTAFTSQFSADGKTWTDLVPSPAITFSMGNDVFIGLAVTSHVATPASGAKFTNVSTTGGVSGSWQMAEIGATQAAGNTPEAFYVAVQDKSGKSTVISNADTSIIATGVWQEWIIPLSQFTSAGVNLGSVQKLTVGVGSRNAPKTGGVGKVYIDDIRLIRQ